MLRIVCELELGSLIKENKPILDICLFGFLSSLIISWSYAYSAPIEVGYNVMYSPKGPIYQAALLSHFRSVDYLQTAQTFC